MGEFVRTFAEKNVGESLACLVAADRYSHLEKEILPAMQTEQVIITDRYVLSSLILQQMDGVNSDFILSLNSEAI